MSLLLAPGTTFLGSGSNGTYINLSTGDSYGMTFTFYVQTPSPFDRDEGVGSFELVQLLDFNNSADLQPAGQTPLVSMSGFELDNTYPYSVTYQAFSSTQTPSNESTNDSPSQTATAPQNNQLASITINDQFEMFLVYTPPVALTLSQDVPLLENPWIWFCQDTCNNGVWASPAGTTSTLPPPWPQPQPPSTTLGPNPLAGSQVNPGYSDFYWSSTFTNTGTTTARLLACSSQGEPRRQMRPVKETGPVFHRQTKRRANASRRF